MTPDPAERPEYDNDTNLVTSHALEVFRSKLLDWDVRLRRIAADATRLTSYPDGTLLIEGGRSFMKLWNMVRDQGLMGEGGIYYPTGLTSLDPFPDKGYELWFTTEYDDALGDLGFTIFWPKIHTYPTNDYRIEDLQITVLFMQKPRAEVRQSFARLIGDWFESVAATGVFEDGPVMPASDAVEFRGPAAQFRLDASQSGQDTLNWLLLRVLTFGYEVSPVHQLIFDQESRLAPLFGIPAGTQPDDKIRL